MAPSKDTRKASFKQQQQQQEVVSRRKETSMDIDLPCDYTTTSNSWSCKDQEVQEVKEGKATSSTSDCSSSSCSTPKAQRFKIPKLLSCPPAPMKRRVASNWSSKISPITFFASPDIELFFLLAFNNITA
ncbi:conserved hypothetical protein [Ricinus communis]|uniref:Uncharacterized protein n=1 Tax=Ricinus communis TaxID=3988 RepID=B9SUG3_RICCO|nr:conserved hypothetical protein [Ricinus communis]